ncbi:thioredoxin [Bovifimicola ammoniilytica]|jgi:thioredoxin 1|uniref:thioredoxin n=1 Tax=Bovifimicola ammoniilytica TaxID=2981720 RepID=UPI0008233AD2|nr:thioredoxin [Bovifimicola ammoniilytica]MCU6754346.1 thioredoxin [Bovifimicola ammoniilytica]SCJ84310.1 Thioredoxin-M [uncultured Eubacterium sp.]
MKILNADNFENEVLESDMPVIVDFYADWCMPCKVMAPVVNEIEKKYINSIKMGKINIDENPMVALDYRVLSIPTLLFIKDGKVLGRLEEAVTKNVVETKIKKYFNL